MTRFLSPVVLALAPAVAQSVSGVWDASVLVNGLEIPFTFEIQSEGARVEGSFFNGAGKVTSTSGRFANGALVLNFDHYDSRLDATLKQGVLEGRYGRPDRAYVFRAKPHAAAAPVTSNAPSIAGLWEIELHSLKGESAWRFIVNQNGGEVSAAILRIDGDTGALTGAYKNGKFVLSHFSGARPMLLEVTPQPDGTLEIVQNAKKHYVAYRPEAARARGLAPPSDPSTFTRVADPERPFRFSFPDLGGHLISNTDSRFRGKVVVVSLMGSWCPNCHDEAPFLVNLYRQYHARGLEIVALSFEDAEQLRNPARLRAFIEHYGIAYPVLLCGEPAQVHDKLPQAVNLNSWPTTFFIARDGRVRSVHAGFPGAASGALHDRAVEEIGALVEDLLDEPLRSAK